MREIIAFFDEVSQLTATAKASKEKELKSKQAAFAIRQNAMQTNAGRTVNHVEESDNEEGEEDEEDFVDEDDHVGAFKPARPTVPPRATRRARGARRLMALVMRIQMARKPLPTR